MNVLKKLRNYFRAIVVSGLSADDFSRGRYEVVKEKAKSLLAQNPYDVHGLFMLVQVAYNTHRYDESFRYFRAIFNNKRVSKNVQRWFPTHVIPHCVYYEQSMCDEVEEWCADLLKVTTDREARTYLLKFRCVCLDRLGRYKEVIQACEALRRVGFVDEHVVRYENKARDELQRQ